MLLLLSVKINKNTTKDDFSINKEERELINKRKCSMIGNGNKHHGTVGRMKGHGLTPRYEIDDDGCSFDFFTCGDSSKYINRKILSLVDLMADRFEQTLPRVVACGNIIPTMLEYECPRKDHMDI